MAHDVFVSYSSQDKLIADAACHALEAEGIRCWMAPRDLPTGLFWKSSVVEAIRRAQLMVLIFSGKANNSSQVKREVDIAFEAGRQIVPFRIENVEMNNDLYYCIAARHWLDALTPPLEQHIEQLVRAVAPLISVAPGSAPVVSPGLDPAAAPPAPGLAPRHGPAGPGSTSGHVAPTPPIRDHTLLRVGLVIGIGVLLLAGWIFGRDRPGEPLQNPVVTEEAEQYTDSYPLSLRAAEDGDPDAQAHIALLYLTGSGVPQDDQAAARWFRRAAEQGNAAGQSRLGSLYLEGRGVKQDVGKGLRWTRLAADQGEPNAQNNLGNLYREGRGLTRNYAAAKQWYLKAAAQGSADAQTSLGDLHREGLGVPKDFAAARQWYLKAAAQGNTVAATRLGALLGDWPLAPLIPGSWQDLNDRQRQAQIALLPDDLQDLRIHRMRRLDLTFYEDATLFEADVGPIEGPRGVLGYVRRGKELVMVDGHSAQIHELNQTAPLRIRNVHEANDYLRFFVGAIQAEDGRFKLIDEVNDLAWRSQATPAQREGVRDKIRLFNIQSTGAGAWTATGTMEYAGDLYNTNLSFTRDGKVEMLNDAPFSGQLQIDHERFDDRGIRVRVRKGS